MLALEAKPTRDLTIGVTGMYATLDATNYNRNHMADFSDAIGSGNGVQDFQYTLSPSGKTINKLVLKNPGVYVNDDSIPSEILESYVRDGARSTSAFLDLNAKYRISDDLEMKAQVGYTKGEGKTPKQNSLEVNVYNGTSAYTLYGMGHAADVSFGSLDTGDFKNPNIVLRAPAAPASPRATKKPTARSTSPTVCRRAFLTAPSSAHATRPTPANCVRLHRRC